MIDLFGKKTIETLIVPAVGRTFNSGDEGRYGYVFLQQLGIEDHFEGKKPRAKAVCNEIVRQLSSASFEDREAARDSLTSLLVSPILVEDHTGGIISALIGSWRNDLRAALGSAFSPQSVTETRSQFFVQIDPDSQDTAFEKVERILSNEKEHTEWVLRLLASRSVAFRGELEVAESQLKAFYKMRSATVIKLAGAGDSEPPVTYPLSHISIKDDQTFLAELRNRVAVYKELLRRKNFPFLLSDIVKRQVIAPAATTDATASLLELTIPPDSLLLSETELMDGSPEEFFEARKLDAVRFMGAVATEANVFYCRANYRLQRCIPLEKIPPRQMPKEWEVVRIGEDLRAELGKIVHEWEIEERIVANLVTEFRGHFVTASEPLNAVLCFSQYIPASDTMGARARMVIVTAEVGSQDLLGGKGEVDQEQMSSPDFSASSPVASSAGIIEDGSCQSAQSAHDRSEALESDDDASGDWMESVIVLLEEREGRDLLEDGSVLIRWFGGFKALLEQANEIKAGATPSDEEQGEGDSAVALYERDEPSTSRYFGLLHDEVEAAFRTPFMPSTGGSLKYCRSFFDLLADRYAAIWELLPTDDKVKPTIIPIKEYSPVSAAMYTLSFLEKHIDQVADLSPEQRENVTAWLTSYKEWCDESTIGLLMSLPEWILAANVYRGEEQSPWSESDSEDQGLSFALADERGEMVAGQFYLWRFHLLQTSLTAEAAETVKELVSRGHIYLDGLCAEFIGCLNTLSLEEIQAAIIQRADHELALNPDEPSSGWFICRKDPKASAARALRASAKSIWGHIAKFRA